MTITGTNFVAGATVDFGSTAGRFGDVRVLHAADRGRPRRQHGPVDVTVSTAGGTSQTSSGDHYSYDLPSVSAVSPSSGHGRRRPSVTVTGTNFASRGHDGHVRLGGRHVCHVFLEHAADRHRAVRRRHR